MSIVLVHSCRGRGAEEGPGGRVGYRGAGRHCAQVCRPELKKDREFVLAAVKQSGNALDYADPELKKDPEIQATAYGQLDE